MRIREKNFKSNLVLVVVLVLESKGLYYINHTPPTTLPFLLTKRLTRKAE